MRVWRHPLIDLALSSEKVGGRAHIGSASPEAARFANGFRICSYGVIATIGQFTLATPLASTFAAVTDLRSCTFGQSAVS
jgi:hypothetical protein